MRKIRAPKSVNILMSYRKDPTFTHLKSSNQRMKSYNQRICSHVFTFQQVKLVWATLKGTFWQGTVLVIIVWFRKRGTFWNRVLVFQHVACLLRLVFRMVFPAFKQNAYNDVCIDLHYLPLFPMKIPSLGPWLWNQCTFLFLRLIRLDCGMWKSILLFQCDSFSVFLW